MNAMSAMNEMNPWVRICRVDEIPVLGARVIERPPAMGNIAVFRNGDDKVFALLDRCPHKGGPLSQGIVYGERVACPLHGWSIQLGDGCAAAPDQGCTPRFTVNVEGGDVFIDRMSLASPTLAPEKPSPAAAHDRSATDQRDGRV